MRDTYFDVDPKAAARFFSVADDTPILMLNLLRFRDVADYGADPHLAPAVAITGREAYERYMAHTEPFLKESGGEVIMTGAGGGYLIGPPEERWDMVMVVRQASRRSFLAFASNAEYRAGIGHRTAALEDSRLLPMKEG